MPVLDKLIQFQELCFALSEREATLPEDHAAELRESIDKARKRLPKDLIPVIDRLRASSSIILAPVEHGACSICRNTLPTALEFSVRTKDDLAQCPGCNRLLYIPEEALRQTGKRTGDVFGRTDTGITRYSSADLMITQLKAKSRDGAIRELAALMEGQGFVEDGAALAALALKREGIAPTAVEKGLAFPHVRGIDGGGLALALGLKKAGLDFKAPDRTKTRIIFFTVIPTASSAFYLKLIAGLNQTFKETEARKQLLASKDGEDTWERLCALTKEAVA